MLRQLTYIVLAIALGSPGFQGNQAPNKDLYNKVPAQHRESLKQLVKLMTELERQRQWNKIYDLIPANERMETREEFVRHYARTSQLIGFEVDSVIQSPSSDKEWIMFGCAVFERKGQWKAWRSGMNATLSDAGWSVSTVLITAGEHGGFTACDRKTK